MHRQFRSAFAERAVVSSDVVADPPNVVSMVLGVLGSSGLLDSTPAGPVDSPMLWAMLAASAILAASRASMPVWPGPVRVWRPVWWSTTRLSRWPGRCPGLLACAAAGCGDGDGGRRRRGYHGAHGEPDRSGPMGRPCRAR